MLDCCMEDTRSLRIAGAWLWRCCAACFHEKPCTADVPCRCCTHTSVYSAPTAKCRCGKWASNSVCLKCICQSLPSSCIADISGTALLTGSAGRGKSRVLACSGCNTELSVVLWNARRSLRYYMEGTGKRRTSLCQGYQVSFASLL